MQRDAAKKVHSGALPYGQTVNGLTTQYRVRECPVANLGIEAYVHK